MSNERIQAEKASETAAQFDTLDRLNMERLASGHDAALNELMVRHGEKLFHFLIRCLQDEEDAADLAQETFVRVYQHRTQFDSRRKFSTWLYSIASNLVKDRYRYRARHPKVSLEAGNPDIDPDFRDSIPAANFTPDAELELKENAEAVREAIASLPEELRVPLILSEYEERSHAEIGEILNCTAKAVETRIYRARQRLRTLLVRPQ